MNEPQGVSTQVAKELAAVLIDFENVFYCLKNTVFNDKLGITGSVVEMIRSLNAYLLKKFGESAIGMGAYADFRPHRTHKANFTCSASRITMYLERTQKRNLTRSCA